MTEALAGLGLDSDGDGCIGLGELVRNPVVRVALLLQNPNLLNSAASAPSENDGELRRLPSLAPPPSHPSHEAHRSVTSFYLSFILSIYVYLRIFPFTSLHGPLYTSFPPSLPPLPSSLHRGPCGNKITPCLSSAYAPNTHAMFIKGSRVAGALTLLLDPCYGVW